MAKRKRNPGSSKPVPNFGGGGMGGGMMNKLQQLQQDMADTQAALKDEVLEVTAGGGVIKIEITGDQKLKSIEIDPEVIDPDDVEMLQDLVLAAVNEAIEKSQEMASERMEGLTGGINIPR